MFADVINIIGRTPSDLKRAFLALEKEA
ncbi:hypothetical protein TNCT_687331, partial [Trichonephila clavata]